MRVWVVRNECQGSEQCVETAASVFATAESWLLAIPRASLSAKLEADRNFACRFYRAVAAFLADRLYVTTGRFGYGSHEQDVSAGDLDEVGEDVMEMVSMGALRFDKLVKHLLAGSHTGSFVGA